MSHADYLHPIACGVLHEAQTLVYGFRQLSYGTPQENHTRTAKLWSAYLGVEITARQVCLLNALQKISRDAHSPARDNLVDLAGYAENAHLVTRDPADVAEERDPKSR